jgi:hypothetical protein
MSDICEIGGTRKSKQLILFVFCGCYDCRLGFLALAFPLTWTLAFFASTFRPAVVLLMAFPIAIVTGNVRVGAQGFVVPFRSLFGLSFALPFYVSGQRLLRIF